MAIQPSLIADIAVMSIAVQNLTYPTECEIWDFERDVYPSPGLGDSKITRRPKNDGDTKRKSVTAVTSSEAGSVASYSRGRYGSTLIPPVDFP